MTENKIHYCTVGTVQRKFGLYLTGAGSEATKAGEAYPHEYHSSEYYFTWRNGRRLPEGEYQLLYIRNGRGVIEFERGKSIPVAGGSVIILHPGEWHRYRPNPKVGWSEAYIGIGGDYLDKILCEPFFPSSPTIIKIEPDTRFDRELMSLVSEIQFESAEHPYTLALKTAALMMSLCEGHARPHGKSAHNVTIRKANLYISAHLNETIDFAALAHSYNMGYTLFRRCFSEYNAMAPLEYQNAMRIRRAMGILTGSNLPVAQIAADVGFHSAAYFSKFFHAHTGMTPIQFRNSRRV
jgi:AraC-like DNA-binding protein